MLATLLTSLPGQCLGSSSNHHLNHLYNQYSLPTPPQLSFTRQSRNRNSILKLFNSQQLTDQYADPEESPGHFVSEVIGLMRVLSNS